jgi:malate dehydrogenase
VFGEHGLSMVPLWESVEVLTSDPSHYRRLATLRAKALETPLSVRISMLREEVNQLLTVGHFADAYRATFCALPDVRIVVEPLITVRIMNSTPNATANATLQLIAAVIAVEPAQGSWSGGACRRAAADRRRLRHAGHARSRRLAPIGGKPR